jgi:hypothetical protein
VRGRGRSAAVVAVRTNQGSSQRSPLLPPLLGSHERQLEWYGTPV